MTWKTGIVKQLEIKVNTKHRLEKQEIDGEEKQSVDNWSNREIRVSSSPIQPPKCSSNFCFDQRLLFL